MERKLTETITSFLTHYSVIHTIWICKVLHVYLRKNPDISCIMGAVGGKFWQKGLFWSCCISFDPLFSCSWWVWWYYCSATLNTRWGKKERNCKVPSCSWFSNNDKLLHAGGAVVKTPPFIHASRKLGQELILSVFFFFNTLEHVSWFSLATVKLKPLTGENLKERNPQTKLSHSVHF